MDSMRITVLETYDLKFCCVCTQNGGNFYLNVFANVIVYRDVYYSLAVIVNETLGFNVQQNTGQLQDICVNCKTKLVDFFIFKRRNEEARKIFRDSSALDPPMKNMLLQVVDQIDNSLSTPEESQDGEVTELGNDDQMLVDDDTKEEFLEPEETEQATEAVQDVDDDLDEDDEDDVFENNLSIEDKSIKEELIDLDESVEATQAHESQTNSEFLEDDDETAASESLSNTSKRKSIRRSNPDAWIRNKRKLAKNTGQSYVASNGKFINAKQMKANCGKSCRMQCSKKITEEHRLTNFKHFYHLADIAKQRKFLFDHMKTYEPKRNKTPKNPQKIRAVQRCYFLNKVHDDNDAKDLLQVCKLMFLNTFSISSQMIDTLFRKATNEGRFNDTRGKFERKQSKSHEFCAQHIAKYSDFKSEQTISVARLYKLYLDECQLMEVEALKEPNYLEIYKHHNFLQLDKLSCTTCSSFHQSSSKVKAHLQPEYDKHIASSEVCKNPSTSLSSLKKKSSVLSLKIF